MPHDLLSLGRITGSQACPAASSSSSSESFDVLLFRARFLFDILFFWLCLAVDLLVGNRPTKKTAKRKPPMSGRGSNKGSKKRKASSQKGSKQPKRSKRPLSCSTWVKPEAPPAEVAGNCVNGPLLVDSFPELIKAMEGVYINTARGL